MIAVWLAVGMVAAYMLVGLVPRRVSSYCACRYSGAGAP
jgi:hypothetical protein